jgi:anti-anti-sigma factor
MSGDGAALEVVLAHLDGYVRVKLRGDLDYATVEEQDEAIQAVTELRRNVVLDLSEVEFIDSGGLAMLLAIARDHDGPVAVEGAKLAHRRLFETTGLDHVFELRE